MLLVTFLCKMDPNMRFSYTDNICIKSCTLSVGCLLHCYSKLNEGVTVRKGSEQKKHFEKVDGDVSVRSYTVTNRDDEA